MLDIGGWELMIVAIIAIIVVGPKDLPGLIRNVSMWMRRARGLVDDFRAGLDDIARDSELDSIRTDINNAIGASAMQDHIAETIDPTGEIEEAVNMGELGSDDGEPAPDTDVERKPEKPV